MKAKISVFAICVEAIIYLFLHNLHDCHLIMILNIIDIKYELSNIK